MAAVAGTRVMLASYDTRLPVVRATATYVEVTLSRDADQQAVHGAFVARGALQPGDLVFFRNSATGPIGHVGMYIGDANMIDAPHTGAVIRIDQVSSFAYYAGARRYLPG
jgi:cell wall-associated NlpC family hydrolase